MGIRSDVKAFFQASRSLPQPAADLSDVAGRGGRYGEQRTESMIPKSHLIADEGSYYVATNPVPGTGLASIAAPTALVDTSPFAVLQNLWSSTDTLGKRLYLDYVKLICTVAGTGGSSIRYNVKTDTVRATAPTGGTTIVPVNANSDAGNLSKAAFYAGALVAAAASSSARLLGGGLIRPAIPVIGDTYVINFGGHEFGLTSMAPAGVAIAQMQFGHAPIVIGPQQAMYFHLWLPAQSAASSYEIECGYWER